MCKRKGYSFLELLVVMAIIILIIAIVVVPALNMAREAAKKYTWPFEKYFEDPAASPASTSTGRISPSSSSPNHGD